MYLLGVGATTTDGNPTLVSVSAVSLALGSYATLAVGAPATCEDNLRPTPTVVTGLSDVAAISYGGGHVRSVHRDGSVSCFTIAVSNTLTAPVVVSGLNVF